MTDKQQFLETVRVALRDGIPPNLLRPLPDTPNDPIEYTPDLSDTLGAFIRSAGDSGAELVGTPDEALDVVVRRVLDTVAPKVVAVSNDPECDGVAETLTSAGIEISAPNDIAATAAADLGITGAVAGIALTGSVVVDAKRAKGRLASLLPKVHLVLLSTRRIVSTPGDVFRKMDDWFPDGLPSNVVLITGPSRSADIELEITEGVHGPQQLLIALVD
ncbi:MAG: LUD domain-containing protein [Acidimicrobiia bacterium]|jgi:L-lactate utilization protein LutC